MGGREGGREGGSANGRKGERKEGRQGARGGELARERFLFQPAHLLLPHAMHVTKHINTGLTTNKWHKELVTVQVTVQTNIIWTREPHTLVVLLVK